MRCPYWQNRCNRCHYLTDEIPYFPNVPRRNVPVVTTERRYKDRVCRTCLLRRGYREGGKVKNETLGNICRSPSGATSRARASLPPPRLLRSRAPTAPFRPSEPPRLGLASLARPGRERDLACACLIVLQLETTWWRLPWPTSSGSLTPTRTNSTRRGCWPARKKLAARHFSEGGIVLLSSSYGLRCPLARRGHNEKELQVNCSATVVRWRFTRATQATPLRERFAGFARTSGCRVRCWSAIAACRQRSASSASARGAALKSGAIP